jgi:hypothetical protein
MIFFPLSSFLPGSFDRGFTLISALWRRRLTLDSSLYQIQEEYLTPFGSRGQKTYSFRDVQQVTVHADSEGFTVKVTLQSQKPLLSIFSSSEREARAEAEKLGQLLGCPVIFLRGNKVIVLEGRSPERVFKVS